MKDTFDEGRNTMIKIKYERYHNDYNRKIEEKTFYDLKKVTDWLFDNVSGNYKDKMFFIDPDSRLPYFGGKLNLDSSCISTRYDVSGYETWVLLIEKDGAIIYSTGRFTNGISYWNEEVKQWLRDCRERQLHPVFNFG